MVVVPGDLAVRRFGLPQWAFEGIAASIDAVVHLGADLDMFASADALNATNVQGTRHVLELAAMAAAPVSHLSSSSVLPLDSHSPWDESRRGITLLERIAPRLDNSDGYSQTKLAAESLMWQALAQGWKVSVFRVPHLIGDSDGRLVSTLRTLLSLNVLPDGDWTWQFASLDAVADRLVTHVGGGAGAPLIHLASPTVSAAALAAIPSLTSPPRRLPLPALANLVAVRARASEHPTRPLAADLLALDQLVREYGIRAALCLGEASLASQQPLTDDVLGLLAERLSAAPLD
jgi:thioester reductase-like protein